ncbi:hypothetical protein ACFV1S_28445 [Streptomyces globisporus]|uniref:hypothetical protein n=1 Tax=Streptomyces TaxID=1883 RepID=UPI000B204DD5|nr:hypothetical protein [Streptomyces sp. TSRI0445]
MQDETSLWRESGLRLSGFGHYYPRLLVENESAEYPAGNAVDEAVIGRLDVRSRHVADEEETPAYMGVRAARAALEQAGVTPGEIDLVVFSNWTDRQFVPEWAPHTAHLLGAERALAFDVCGACTGFVHGVQTAAAYFGTHADWRHALVVSSERFSRRVRPGSKGELIVGDAAGAAVLSRGAEPDAGLWDSLLISDGSGRETVTVYPPNG